MTFDAIFCDNIGNTTNKLHCCYANQQSSSVCERDLYTSVPWFSGGCDGGDCVANCQNSTWLYESKIQDDAYEGNGFGPIRRYQTCANVPAIAGYASQGALSSNISAVVESYVSPNATAASLTGITSTVTECLTQTCRASRNRGACESSCSAVNLITNSTTPNVQSLNSCLNTLCGGQWDSLPYADADVIGIGVFASYIMQCMFVTLLWFGLFGFEIYNRRKAKRQTPLPERMSEIPSPQHTEKTGLQKTVTWSSSSEAPRSHQSIFEDFVVQFHKAQCYFSAILQVASLSYGIFEIDMLVTFMLIPLATNGVLPIVFAFVILFRCGRATMDICILTMATYTLASIVYWILYSHIIPINAMMNDKRRYMAYQQFMYKLSAIDACGGYSALAVCPDNFVLGRQDIFDASHNLRVLTPIIWSFSTICLIAVLFGKVMKWRRAREEAAEAGSDAQHQHHDKGHSPIPADDSDDPLSSPPPDTHDTLQTSNTTSSSHSDHHHGAPPFFRSRVYASATFWFTTTCFLAGIGMQLSLLAIGTSLNMMNRRHWSFGQIVAVTIWAEPLLGYLYDEGKLLLRTRWGIGE